MNHAGPYEPHPPIFSKYESAHSTKHACILAGFYTYSICAIKKYLLTFLETDKIVVVFTFLLRLEITNWTSIIRNNRPYKNTLLDRLSWMGKWKC